MKTNLIPFIFKLFLDYSFYLATVPSIWLVPDTSLAICALFSPACRFLPAPFMPSLNHCSATLSLVKLFICWPSLMIKAPGYPFDFSLDFGDFNNCVDNPMLFLLLVLWFPKLSLIHLANYWHEYALVGLCHSLEWFHLCKIFNSEILLNNLCSLSQAFNFTKYVLCSGYEQGLWGHSDLDLNSGFAINRINLQRLYKHLYTLFSLTVTKL